MQTWRHLGQELMNHLPFTVFATGAGVLLAGVLTYGAVLVTEAVDRHAAALVPGSQPDTHGGHEHASHRHDEPGHSDSCPDAHAPHGTAAHPAVHKASHVIFHVFHPLHMLLSAIATTAMFWRHDRRLITAVFTGIIGSVGICGLSDVVFPYLSGLLLGVDMEFHWCIIQHPMIVVPFMAVGVLTGLLAATAVEHSTQYSHAGHVFVSSAASIFYLISFGLFDWVSQVGYVFFVVVIAVIIPCCLSDIIFPLLVANRQGLAECPHRNHLHRVPGEPDDHGDTPDTHHH